MNGLFSIAALAGLYKIKKNNVNKITTNAQKLIAPLGLIIKCSKTAMSITSLCPKDELICKSRPTSEKCKANFTHLSL